MLELCDSVGVLKSTCDSFVNDYFDTIWQLIKTETVRQERGGGRGYSPLNTVELPNGSQAYKGAGIFHLGSLSISGMNHFMWPH